MSMEISNRYGFDHINKVQTGQTESAEEAAKFKEKDRPEKIPAPKDEYISSEKSGKKPSCCSSKIGRASCRERVLSHV